MRRAEMSRGDRLSKSYPYFNQGERVELRRVEASRAEMMRDELSGADRYPKL